MKQHLAVMALAATTAWSAGAVAEPPVFDVPRLDEITIDGDAGDWGGGRGKASRGLVVETMVGPFGRVRLPGDLDAAMRLGWDDEGLVVLLRVRDDVHREHEDVEALWRADAVELYLAVERGKGPHFQAVVAPGLAEGQPDLRAKVYNHAEAPPIKGRAMTVEAARTKVEDGYVMEARLPWANLDIEPKLGLEVGFQADVADVDGEGEQFHIAWRPRLGAFANPDAMHRLRLSEKPGDPLRASLRVSMVGHAPLTATVVGPRDMAGKEAAIVAGDRTLAKAKLAAQRGRAVAVIDLEAPLPEGEAERLAVSVDGEVVGVNTEPIAPPPAMTARQRRGGGRVARTMSRLAYSTASHRMPVKVLFYGQSIVESDWWREVAAALEHRYPHADLTIENKALGGWEAHRLIDAAEADVYPAGADLVVFHVYAGELSGQVERIISKMRRRTTADILLFTHHAPLGANFDTGAQQWRLLAQRYGCELADVRKAFKRYLAEHGLKPEDVLRDSVHPNALGNKLIATTVMRHLRPPDEGGGAGAGWTDRVRRHEVLGEADDARAEAMRYTGEPWATAPRATGRKMPSIAVGRSPDSSLELSFEGDRVDVIVGEYGGETGTAKVMIDGKPPSEHRGTYMMTRVSPPRGSGWPALRKVEHVKPLLAERWTLKIVELDRSAARVAFEAVGSKTGPDGEGTSEERFVSESGRVVIEPDWWMLAAAKRHTGGRPEVGDEVRWEVVCHGVDAYDPGALLEQAADKAARYARQTDSAARRNHARGWVARQTLARGLGGGRHTLTITPNGDGPVPIRAIVVHNPPLD